MIDTQILEDYYQAADVAAGAVARDQNFDSPRVNISGCSSAVHGQLYRKNNKLVVLLAFAVLEVRLHGWVVGVWQDHLFGRPCACQGFVSCPIKCPLSGEFLEYNACFWALG